MKDTDLVAAIRTAAQHYQQPPVDRSTRRQADLLWRAAERFERLLDVERNAAKQAKIPASVLDQVSDHDWQIGELHKRIQQIGVALLDLKEEL